jgi:hypothetical protein
MTSRSKKSSRDPSENSDLKLSRLIEKLNAELKVMNEINPSLAAENQEPTKINIPGSGKRKPNLKPKRS